MIVSFDRKSCRPRVAISSPSMMILPMAFSIMRNNAMVSEDFPAPVLPTIPIFKSKEKSFFLKTNIN